MYVRLKQIWVLIKRGAENKPESEMGSGVRKIVYQDSRLKCVDWTERFTLNDLFINKVFLLL